MNNSSHIEYRQDIDGLRAIAVFSVVIYHAFPELISGGFIGVDIFFVISGFLITSIILKNLTNNKFSFKEFYRRRINRIFPALLLVMAFSYISGWFLLLPDEYTQLNKHILGGSGFASNFIYWNESGYFDIEANKKPLLHLWSLAIEEQFYIIWPFIIWIGYKKGFNFIFYTLLLVCASFLLNIIYTETHSNAAFYSLWTRAWELLIGAMLAYCKLSKAKGNFVKEGNSSKLSSTLMNFSSPIGLGLILIGMVTITKESLFPGWLATLPTVGAAMIISADQNNKLNRHLLSNPLLTYFGRISYPLYLWHWPLLSFLHLSKDNPSTLDITLTVIISIILSSATYLYIEKPIRFSLKFKFKTQMLVFLMLLTGFISGYSYLNKGLSFRFPNIIQELSNFKYNYRNAFREGTCYLTPQQDYSTFKKCPENTKSDKENILLWGDSHAAHLYFGYEKNFGNKYNIIQRTASLCPPLLNMEIKTRPHCKKINDEIFNSLADKEYRTIILSGYWTYYNLDNLEYTIKQLKQSGNDNIKLIGPTPQWHDRLPKQLYLYFKSNITRELPKRMFFGLNKNFIKIDSELSEFSSNMNIEYISTYQILCNDEGCLTRLGDSGETLTAWDYGHLTEASSEYLISKFPEH